MSLSPPASTPVEIARSQARWALDRLRRQLLEARQEDGHWTGTLSPSALSTATAVSAMCAVLADRETHPKASVDRSSVLLRQLIRRGMDYLRRQQNTDGGFGDTDRSHSNIATSYLVLAASTLADKRGFDALDPGQLERLNGYLDRSGRLNGLRARYGKDKTFVVPIMNNMAIAGLISWDDVAALPFEAAIFPQSMYRFLQMPVVSYAIPALVAIGQARHFLGRKTVFPLRLLRSMAIGRTLRVLRRMQPESGGYLEATPLTAFVVMSLAATGRSGLQVVDEGLKFLQASILDDGSWPIDTNLATWVTSLSVHALASDPEDDGDWYSDELLDWHLGCQHQERHPFTGAEPGGWGWTDLTGAVPDSDDTPAAILALGCMRRFADAARIEKLDQAVRQGESWLRRLQNRNGGWPTFCRGWGKLPFDRSSTDLTAHAIRAIRSIDHQAAADDDRVAIRSGIRFLEREQQASGAWLPLWFGNQDREDESNPIYGTAKVLVAGAVCSSRRDKGVDFLIRQQNADGGWGGGQSLSEKIAKLAKSDPEMREIDPKFSHEITSSVEETALAVEALAAVLLQLRSVENDGEQPFQRSNSGAQVLEKGVSSSNRVVEMTGGELPGKRNNLVGGQVVAAGNEPVIEAILRGVEFLVQSVRDRRHEVAWPIGFYFAKLWYHERLYPLIFATTALGKFLRATETEINHHWPK
ncbi:prenyltransferase/squalene oxidase repeat-containing protein [Roseiconus lacunae]